MKVSLDAELFTVSAWTEESDVRQGQRIWQGESGYLGSRAGLALRCHSPV